MRYPLPPHLLHVVTRISLAKPVLWTLCTSPEPPQTSHFFVEVPGLAPLPLQVPQISVLGASISFVTSCKASSSPSSRGSVRAPPYLSAGLPPPLSTW